MKTQHTPTPWRVGCYGSNGYSIYKDNGEAGNVLSPSKMPSKDDADFIVRAVNSHEALLEALKDMQQSLIDLYKDHGDIAGKYFGARLSETNIETIQQAEVN